MKTRITILAENDKHNDSATEEKVKKAWQIIFDNLMLFSEDPSEKVVIEKVEVFDN